MSERRGSWPGGILWRGVGGADVLMLLKQFEFADKHLIRTPSTAVRDYIADRRQTGELNEWTVVVLGTNGAGTNENAEGADPGADISVMVAGQKLWTLDRKRISDRPSLYVLKRIGSPKDESIDLSPAEWAEVDRESSRIEKDPQRPERTKRGRLIREKRPPSRGLLILYLLTPGARADASARAIPMVAPFISFPNSPNAKPVRYAVNHRYWEEEMGGVE